MGTTIGTLHVRRSGFVRANPDRVWEEFASFDRLREWFGIGHTLHAYEPKVGANVELSVELDGARQHFGGPITVIEPAREVTFECDWHDPSLARTVPMSFTLRLTPIYDGTMVEIFHHGFERLGEAAGSALEDYEDGWDNRHLKALRALVEQ
jgi:uncharacterized protein YndB with AHSA1/START domain